MATISQISVSFIANTAKFTEGLTGMRKDTAKFSKGIQNDMKDAGADLASIGKKIGAGMAVVGVALVAGIAKSVNEISNLVDEAKKIGIATSQLQILGYAARTSGSDLETVKRGFVELQKSTTDALAGNEQAIGSFYALGISIEELAKLNPAERFRLVTAALAAIPNANDRAKIGMEILGKTYTELTPMMSQSLEKVGAEGAKIGQVLSDIDNANIKELGENAERLGDALTGAFNTLAGAVAPIINDAINGFKRWITEGTNFRDTLLTVVNVVGTVGIVIGNIIDSVRAFINLGSSLFSGLAGVIVGIFELGMKSLGTLVDLFELEVNNFIALWNSLPFTKKIDPIKIDVVDDASGTLENIRKGSVQAAGEFAADAGNNISHGVANDVGNIVSKVQDGIIKTNQNGIDAAKQTGNAISAPQLNKMDSLVGKDLDKSIADRNKKIRDELIAAAKKELGGNDAIEKKKYDGIPTDAYSKIGLMTSGDRVLPGTKEQTKYLKDIAATLKLIRGDFSTDKPASYAY